MGKRKGIWVASSSSIGVRFRLQGEWIREFVRFPPTPRKLANWEARRSVIVQEIAENRFDYAKWFPHSPRAKGKKSTQTVGHLLNRWLKGQEKVFEETTLKKVRQIVDNILIPVFGHLRTDELNSGHIQDWIDSHELTRKTTSNYLSPLRQAFLRAVHIDRILDEDPLVNYRVRQRRIDKQRRASKKGKADPFYDKELQLALKTAQPDLAVFVRFAIWSGLRLEEMFELYWADINLTRKEIRVQRARVRKTVKVTKTPASNRIVTLLPDAEAALEDARALYGDEAPHVFLCCRTGRPWSDDALRDAWKKACVRADVRYRPPKQFRHTFAHRMLTAGEDIAAISVEMGHENVGITAQFYAGFLRELKSKKFGDKAIVEYGQGPVE